MHQPQRIQVLIAAARKNRIVLIRTSLRYPALTYTGSFYDRSVNSDGKEQCQRDQQYKNPPQKYEYRYALASDCDKDILMLEYNGIAVLSVEIDQTFIAVLI